MNKLRQKDERINSPRENNLKDNLKDSKMIGNYILGRTLGKGTFGKVKIAVNKQTGQKVAIKILNKAKIIDISDVQRVSRQIYILKMLRHPAIIQLYEIIETEQYLFLVIEYLSKGQLFEHIVKKKKLSETQACQIFHQLISAVQYIHQLKIVHRDLKPQNLLLDGDNTIRVIDFGLSNTYTDKQKLKTACGSPCYAAPEMIEGKSNYEPVMVDIWSCGVILYAMVCGFLPFQDSQTSKLYKKILEGTYSLPEHISTHTADFLSKILQTDPDKRIKIKQIRQHPFWKLVKNYNINDENKGIIVGYNKIPVDEKILRKVAAVGLDRQFTKKCIQSNRHTIQSTVYYLLLKKYIRQGGISQNYIGSNRFNPKRIDAIEQKQIKKLLNIDDLKTFKKLHQGKNYRIFNRTLQVSSIDEQQQNNQPIGAKKAYDLMIKKRAISLEIRKFREGASKNHQLPDLKPYNPEHEIKDYEEIIPPTKIKFNRIDKIRQHKLNQIIHPDDTSALATDIIKKEDYFDRINVNQRKQKYLLAPNYTFNKTINWGSKTSNQKKKMNQTIINLSKQ